MKLIILYPVSAFVQPTTEHPVHFANTKQKIPQLVRCLSWQNKKQKCGGSDHVRLVQNGVFYHLLQTRHLNSCKSSICPVKRFSHVQRLRNLHVNKLINRKGDDSIKNKGN